jgi:uncharacterized protein
MSREFPDFIDPWKAADGRREFQGTMPLKRMARLVPLLAPTESDSAAGEASWADARFNARFAYDRQGMVTIRLVVEAELPLVCQRSLAPYLEKVKRRSVLTVIEDVREQDGLPEDSEPVLVEHRRMALLDIVEEELLLAVPQVPRNPEIREMELSTDGETNRPSPTEENRRHRPFAGLADLLKEDAGD